MKIPVSSKKLVSTLHWLFNVVSSAAHRFYWDDCFSRAAALTYTSLFALVPVSYLTISMFTVFGVTDDKIDENLRWVIMQLLPQMEGENERLLSLQNQIIGYIETFTSNVSGLNQISVAILIFTCLSLLNTIESALNVVWRVSAQMNILTKLVSFWAVLTLGPLCLVLSVYSTAKLSTFEIYGGEVTSQLIRSSNVIAPFLVAWITLLAMFFKMPATKVQLRDAALGAGVSAVLFEILKRVFAYYVAEAVTYSKLYGVLATVPLFMFWMYLMWSIVLYGAEVAYQAGAIKILHGLKKYATDLGEIGGLLGLKILQVIAEKFSNGETPPSESDIAIATGSDPALVRTCLMVLEDGGFISSSGEGNHLRSLLKSPDKITVGEIFSSFFSKNYRQNIFSPVAGEMGDTIEPGLFISEIRRVSLKNGGDGDIRSWKLSDFVRVSGPTADRLPE